MCIVVRKCVANACLLTGFDLYIFSFLITCHLLPLFSSFSQFSIKCGREWVSVVPLTGRPIKLCGSQPPAPFEVAGGNITVTHHFFPQLYPISGFYLYYIKGTEEQPQFLLVILHDMFMNISDILAEELSCVYSCSLLLQTQVPVFQVSLNVTVNVVSQHHGVVTDGLNALVRGMNSALMRTDVMTLALNLTWTIPSLPSTPPPCPSCHPTLICHHLKN